MVTLRHRLPGGWRGLQVLATGVLRGAGNTRMPMLANLVAHWAIGMPAAYILCFPLGLGVRGLWLGLCAGLMVVGSYLLLSWRRSGGQRPGAKIVPRELP